MAFVPARSTVPWSTTSAPVTFFTLWSELISASVAERGSRTMASGRRSAPIGRTGGSVVVGAGTAAVVPGGAGTAAAAVVPGAAGTGGAAVGAAGVPVAASASATGVVVGNVRPRLVAAVVTPTVSEMATA